MADQIQISLDFGSFKVESQLKALHNTLRSMDATVAKLKTSLHSMSSGTNFYKEMNRTLTDGRSVVKSYFDLANQKIRQNTGLFSIARKELRSFLDTQSLGTTIVRSFTFQLHEMFASLPRGIVNIAKLHAEYLGFRNALGVAEGSLDAANASLQTSIDIATRLKLPVRVVTKEYAKFMNAVRLVGFNVNEATSAFTDLASSARVLNLSQQQVSGMFLALEQMVSKGTVSMEELRRQLGNSLPGAVDIAALAFQDKLPKSADTAAKKIQAFIKMVKEGKVQSAEFLKVFTKFLRVRTDKFLDESLKTFAANLTEFQNQWELFKVRLGEGLSHILNPFIKGLTWLFEVINSFTGANELFANSQNDVVESLVKANSAVTEIKTTYTEAKESVTSLADKMSGLTLAFVGITGGAAGLRLAFKGLISVLKSVLVPLGSMLAAIPLLGGYFKSTGVKIAGAATAVVTFVKAINPLTWIISGVVTGLGSLIYWLEKSQDEANNADRAFEKFNAQLRNVKKDGEVALTTLQSLSESLSNLSGISRLGASYVVAGLETEKLIKKQQDLKLVLQALRLQLETPLAKADKTFVGLINKQITETEKKLKALPGLIKQSQAKQKALKGGLVAAGSVKDEEKPKKKLRSTTQKLKEENSGLAMVYDLLYDNISKNVDIMFELDSLWQDGVITSETYYQAIKKLNEENKKASNVKVLSNKSKPELDSIDQYFTDLKKQGDDLASVYINAFQSMEDALVQFVTTGKFNFRSFAQSVIADLTRMIAKQMIFNAFSSAFKNTGGGLLGGLGSILGIGGGAPVSSVPIPTGTFAKGTNYLPKDTFAQLHKGEAVVPAKYNPDNPNAANAPTAKEKAMTIVNVMDMSMLTELLAGAEGEEIFTNHISRNPNIIRQAIS